MKKRTIIKGVWLLPCPGQLSADDFVTFYRHPKTFFSKDIPNLYQ